MERFHTLASTTLGRTNRAYFVDEFGRSFSWILMAAIPLVGLLYFDWSASEWLLFLLIGAWTGIILDSFKLYFLNDQIMKSADAAYEDNFVWTIVDSLREDKQEAPADHLRAKYQPGMGVFVDLVFGGIGTMMTLALFPDSILDTLQTNSLRWSVLGMTAYRVALTVWEIIEQRSTQTEDRQVRVAVGLRGVGLFMLGFLVAMIVGDEVKPRFSGDQTAWWTMLLVNALTIFGSLLNVWGISMIYSNSKWLRRYLEERAG